MRLWTVQSIDVYEQVMSTGDYSVNLDHPEAIGGIFKDAYAWLRGKAVERGLVDNGRGMIWSWYRRGALHRKPDVRTLRKTNMPGSQLCCLTLEVPDDKVLLMDSDQWNSRLNGSPCTTAEEEAMDLEEFSRHLDAIWALPEEDRRKYTESSWDLIFDTSRATWIEAIFFGLDRSMIKDVQFFTGEWNGQSDSC